MRQIVLGEGARTHDELATDLARFHRDAGLIALTKFQLPHGDQQIDVLAIAPYKYARPDIRAYEVKVSRADFRADERKAKWAGYLRYANRVFFACESGLLKVADIPEDAGLITRGANGWGVAKAARYRLQIPGWDNDTWMALVSRKAQVEAETRRLAERITWDENLPLQERAHNLGWELRSAVARGLAAPGARPDERVRRLDELWTALREIWPELETTWQIKSRIQALEGYAKHAAAVQEIGEFLSSLAYGDETADKKLREARAAVAAAR